MNKNTIIKRFQRMDEMIEILKSYQTYPTKEFLSNRTIQLSTERAIEICINICIDIGAHILTSLGNNTSDSYGEIFTNLAKENIFPLEFANQMRKMVGFRNILGHIYMDIDYLKVFAVLHENITDFTQFKTYILQQFSK
jgi:uncharacterized protein YutE (UPF0331/DUF86 family)